MKKWQAVPTDGTDIFGRMRYSLSVMMHPDEENPRTEATVRANINGGEQIVAGDGDGPIHALDCALRKAIGPSFPQITEVTLDNFQSQIVTDDEAEKGSAARVAVEITFSFRGQEFKVSDEHTNIVHAGWNVLVAAYAHVCAST